MKLEPTNSAIIYDGVTYRLCVVTVEDQSEWDIPCEEYCAICDICAETLSRRSFCELFDDGLGDKKVYCFNME